MSEPKSWKQSRINACWYATPKNMFEQIKPITAPQKTEVDYDVCVWQDKYMNDFANDVLRKQDEWLQDMVKKSGVSAEKFFEWFTVEEEKKEDLKSGKITITYRLVERNEETLD